jgi:hypothetical protein
MADETSNKPLKQDKGPSAAQSNAPPAIPALPFSSMSGGAGSSAPSQPAGPGSAATAGSPTATPTLATDAAIKDALKELPSVKGSDTVSAKTTPSPRPPSMPPPLPGAKAAGVSNSPPALVATSAPGAMPSLPPKLPPAQTGASSEPAPVAGLPASSAVSKSAAATTGSAAQPEPAAPPASSPRSRPTLGPTIIGSANLSTSRPAASASRGGPAASAARAVIADHAEALRTIQPQRDEPAESDADGEDEADSKFDTGTTSQRRAARRRPAGPSRPNAPAANDDLPSIGGLIFALHQQPSKRPMQIAAIASVAWGFLGILLGWAMLAPELQRAPSFFEMLSKPTAISLAATVLIPIALFWFLALLVWRAQELRLMSSAMTEVAIRLAEPDRMAEQQIASVGQAVRRQVSHMNEAVSRALGRAGELEALVHNEVASLEQSYTQNENRIRGLLQELSGERHALLNTSERVNATLKEFGSEIPVLIDKLGDQQVKLSRFIEGAGQNLVALESSLSANAKNLATTIGARTSELQNVLTERTEAFEGAVAGRTHDMQALFDSFSQGLDTTLGRRTEGLQTVLEEYTRALDATLAGRQESLDSQLIERTKTLDNAFTERLQLFDESIIRSTVAIDSTVADKTRALSTALESHAKEIGSVLGRQAHELDQQIIHGVEAVRRASDNVTRQSVKAIEGLSGQADLLKNVSENLVNQISGVTNRFDQQGQTIMRAANALESANFRIDKTLQNRQAELSETLERLSGKTDDIDRVMQGYTTTIAGTFDQAEMRARYVGEQLARGAEEHSRMTMAEMERLQSMASGETDRALADLRSKFSNVSREVSEEIGSLSSRFSDSSEEMRQRARHTMAEIGEEQTRLREQLERLPDATRASAERMRASLQDQLRALDQLSSLSRRETARADISPPNSAATANLQPVSSRSISSVTQSLANEMATRTSRPAPDMRPAPARQAPSPQPGGSYNLGHVPVPVPVPSQHPAAMGGDGAREGWSLGDLLARASQDDDPQRLQINVANVARALDATTASAIWSRFRAGQRGVMVRSIYTADGRTAFDDVQNRTRTDPTFRQTVERYIMDFEQLLRDADQRDPSGRTTQSYIVSDSGRVYLFLAHASGRLA